MKLLRLDQFDHLGHIFQSTVYYLLPDICALWSDWSVRNQGGSEVEVFCKPDQISLNPYALWKTDLLAKCLVVV